MPLFRGDDGPNVIDGTAGDDTVFGFGGGDTLTGGDGGDTVDGGPGDDLLGLLTQNSPVEFGDDIYVGGPGNDSIGGGVGSDTIFGGDGDDLIFADAPTIRGTGGANDWISGGPGSDTISGGLGFDVAYFELPRRAYTTEGGTLPPPVVALGVRVTLGRGAAAEPDFLIGIEELRFADGRIAVDLNDVSRQAARLYEAGLGREPDMFGESFWASKLAAGVRLGAVGEAFLQTPEFQARYGALDNTGFVQTLYQNALSRPGEAAGVDYWVSTLNSGVIRGEVLVAFANSAENGANTSGVAEAGWIPDERASQVARLYDAAFDRLPDLNGFLANKAALDAGLGLDGLARNFAGSAEFAALHGGPDAAPEALVEALYANALNRPADPEGFAHWTGAIRNGALTREQAILGISESPEHQALALPFIEGGVVFT